MDVQSMIVEPAPSAMLAAVARAIVGARTAAVPVVYVRIALRRGDGDGGDGGRVAHRTRRPMKADQPPRG
jgi:nicotinamidase-related amidase